MDSARESKEIESIDIEKLGDGTLRLANFSVFEGSKLARATMNSSGDRLGHVADSLGAVNFIYP